MILKLVTLSLAAVVAMSVIVPIALAGSRGAGHPGHSRGHRLAKHECQGDRREEPREFAGAYGGLGRKALQRCIADEERDHGW